MNRIQEKKILVENSFITKKLKIDQFFKIKISKFKFEIIKKMSLKSRIQ